MRGMKRKRPAEKIKEECCSTRAQPRHRTDASDVILAEHPDGTIAISPMYVSLKHGKLDDQMIIAINDEKLDGSVPLKKLAEQQKTGVAVCKPDEIVIRQIYSIICRSGGNEVNKIKFYVNGQPEQSVTAYIFYWNWKKYDKLFIWDLDGTMTRSDLGGLLRSWFGVSWFHQGVREFFSWLLERGHRIIILTARPTSIINSTRKSIFSEEEKKEGSKKEKRKKKGSSSEDRLPRVPVLTTTFGRLHTIEQFLRCVPHSAFKVPCLENIRGLFPKDETPFHAAFGNRKTDVTSYVEVGIPREKIFFVLKHGDIETRRENGKRTRWFASFEELCKTLDVFNANFKPIEQLDENQSQAQAQARAHAQARERAESESESESESATESESETESESRARAQARARARARAQARAQARARAQAQSRVQAQARERARAESESESELELESQPFLG